MPTINCVGGHSFSDGLIPSPHDWRLLSDEKVESVVEEIERHTREGADPAWALSVIDQHSLPVVICPMCGRLLLFKDGWDKPAVSYKKED